MTSIYGTEVFELSEPLRDLAVAFAKTATLNDTATAQAYRARYASYSAYAAGAAPPTVVPCDVATSDVREPVLSYLGDRAFILTLFLGLLLRCPSE
jgi:purine nucleoside permease